MSEPVTLESALSYLQQTNEEGKSLYDLLVDVFMRLMLEHPNDPLGSFEYLVTLIKNNKVRVPEEPLPKVLSEEIMKSKSDWVSTIFPMFHVLK